MNGDDNEGIYQASLYELDRGISNKPFCMALLQSHRQLILHGINSNHKSCVLPYTQMTHYNEVIFVTSLNIHFLRECLTS